MAQANFYALDGIHLNGLGHYIRVSKGQFFVHYAFYIILRIEELIVFWHIIRLFCAISSVTIYFTEPLICAVTLFRSFIQPYELFDCAQPYELFDYTGSICFWGETYTTRVYNLFRPLTSLGVPNCTRYFVPLARSLAYNISDSILF